LFLFSLVIQGFFGDLARFARTELSPSQTFQSLSTSLRGLDGIMTKDMDVETAAQIAATAFARDLMVSNLGQMSYESEVGKLKLASGHLGPSRSAGTRR
jgi:hypothetical protein